MSAVAGDCFFRFGDSFGVTTGDIEKLGQSPVRLEPVWRPGDGVSQAAFYRDRVVLGGEQQREVVPGVLAIDSCGGGAHTGLNRLLAGLQSRGEDRRAISELGHFARIIQVESSARRIPGERGAIANG